MFKIPGKIPISIYPFFWVLAFLIGWLNTASVPGTIIWAGVILVSILVHEFGHALTAVAFGQKARIELVGFGGVTHRNGGRRLKLWQEFVIVLNGPVAGFCLAGVSWWLYQRLQIAHPESPLTYAVEVAFYVNFIWTILNLLPVQPLDGGKLLSIFLESIFGLKGTKIALFISLLLAAAFGIIFFTLRQYFIGSLFMLFTFESYKAWKESLSVTEDDKNSTLQNLLKEAEAALRSGRQADALENFKQIRESSKAGIIYQVATENMAHLLADQGDLKQAYETIASLGGKVSPDGINLLHQLAYSQNQWDETVAIGDKAYKNRPSYQTALINAAAHAALGSVKPAIGWLQCAIHDGMPHPQQVLARNEFDRIRSDPLFREFNHTIL